MSGCDFTHSHYEEILELIKKKDYKATFFNESCLNEKEIILRHDIDVDLEKAYRMALLENKHQIRSTYFIFLRSPFYNIFDRSGQDYIRELLNLGHQIGLHFDEAAYDSDKAEAIIKNVDAEVQILRETFDTKIFTVSFHRPSQFLLQSNIKLNNHLINTYDKNITEEFQYISDSRRMWKNGCLCRLLEKTGTDSDSFNYRIQALVHPVWWTEESLSAQETLERFLLQKLKNLDNELEKNIQIYRRLF